MTDVIHPHRRGFLLGMGAILAAPAIIKVASLMPIKAPKLFVYDDFGGLAGDESDLVVKFDISRSPMEDIEIDLNTALSKALSVNRYAMMAPQWTDLFRATDGASFKAIARPHG